MKTPTKLNHQFGSPDVPTRSLVQPLHLSTIFAMETPSSDDGFQYGRVGNPTRHALEKTLEEINKAKFCHVFSSGSSALSSLLLTLKKGDKIICHNTGYEGTFRILQNVFKKLGIIVIFIDLENTSVLKEHLKREVTFVVFETPINPTLHLLDIEKISSACHQFGTAVVVDNTFSTSILQQPLTLGADIVIESLSKGSNGHGDIVGGMIITNNEKFSSQIKNIKETIGIALSPFECLLVLRGLKTLDIRVLQQQKTARKIARFLLSHQEIEKVFFPEISQTPLCRKQMKGPGSLLSFQIKGDTEKFVQSLQLITIGHSFGDTETLIQQPAKMMDLTLTIPINLFRISIGLEAFTDLKKDLELALHNSKL